MGMLSRRTRKLKRRMVVLSFILPLICITGYLIIKHNWSYSQDGEDVSPRWDVNNSGIDFTTQERSIEREVNTEKANRTLIASKKKRESEREEEIRKEEQEKLIAQQKAEKEAEEKAATERAVMQKEKEDREQEEMTRYYEQLTTIIEDIMPYIDGQLNELTIVHGEYGYAYTNSFKGYQNEGSAAMGTFLDELNSMSVPDEYVHVQESIKESIQVLQGSFLEIANSLDNGVDFDLNHAFTLFTDGLAQLRLSLEVIFP